ncbi:MAG: hypothetical protein PHQ86_04855 [Dehalococcoidales bacterium]|nr:hypothetical protein [Dehalococcoidales bacterium]
MRRIFKVLGLAIVVVAILAITIAGTVSADNSGSLGPNPDAGDGIPDGSSLDAPNGPNGDMVGLD